MSTFLREHVPNSCSILRGIGRRPKQSSPTQVGPTRETTSSHLLIIDSWIPSSSRWSTILFHVQLLFILHGPLNSSASVPITKQKRTKYYNSFPNQKSVDSHHNSKSLLFAPIVSQQSVNPFESLTLRFWYIECTKSGKI